MLKKLIWNDMRQNKLMSAATVFFMGISAGLLVLTALLLTNLLGTIDGLMAKAAVPDFLQMHTGAVDEKAIDRFAQSRPEVDDWQLARFLNMDNSSIVLSGHNMADSTQDNGLAVQSERFDFMLGMDGTLPQVSPGEVYVPVCYRAKYGVLVGDEMKIGTERLSVAGFIRDAQMNAMMASSKRFLVNAADYERLSVQGQEEYIIEFLLKDGADFSAFQTAYADSGLPSNGPGITRPLIRMINALSDGTMIFILFLVSAIVLLISLLCIHFILSIQMQRDMRELGMLKALGIDHRSIRRIYFTKYLVFSLAAAFIGLAAALIAQEPLSAQLRELYGTAEQGASAAIAAALAAVLTESVILLSVRRALLKTEKLTALDALFQPQKKSCGRTQYILIGAVTAACTFLMLVPVNLSHTLSDASFVTYMGIGNGELRIDLRQRDDIGGLTDKLSAALARDEQVESFTALKTYSCPTILQDGSRVNLTVEAGDHRVFPVGYSAGTAPEAEGEIALSAMNAQELGLAVGDTLRLKVGGREADYRVCGVYSDITNGGKTAKISDTDLETPLIWSVLYLSLRPGADREAWMEHYRALGVDVVDIADYVQDTYAQTLSQLRLASRAIMGIAALIIAAVLALFSRLIVEQNRYSISLHKALGFTGGECGRNYFAGAMLPAAVGTVIGLLLGLYGGEALCALVLKSFGADGFRLVIDPLQTFALIPLIAIGTAALAIWAGIRGINKIKDYECCMGKE